jgi:hypothetical protein
VERLGPPPLTLPAVPLSLPSEEVAMLSRVSSSPSVSSQGIVTSHSTLPSLLLFPHVSYPSCGPLLTIASWPLFGHSDPPQPFWLLRLRLIRAARSTPSPQDNSIPRSTLPHLYCCSQYCIPFLLSKFLAFITMPAVLLDTNGIREFHTLLTVLVSASSPP